MPRECLKLIESKSKVRQSRAKAVVSKVNQLPAYQALAYQAPIPQTQSVSQTDFESYIKANDAVLKNMQNQGQNVQNQCQGLQNQIANLTDMLSKFVSSNTASSSGSGTLLGNTITNLKEDLKGITSQSSVAYQGPTIPTPSKVVKQGTEVTKDQAQTLSLQSTASVQPPVVQSETQTSVSEPVVAPVSASMPNLKPSIPYPSRRDNERCRDQANEQIKKFYEIFKDMSFEISFTDALILMPKFASTLKALIGNKEKLSEMARTSMNEHCSAVILNKLSRKLGDPGKLLIPCEFPGMDECLALADLGASINLMPLSVWEGLSLPELTLTCMTLELADRSVSKPIGIAKDVSVKVVEKTMEVFMHDFLVFGNSFKNGLSRLDKILQRCEDTNLCLNWENSHFMVQEGIVLGHKFSKNEIKVDKAKVDVIAKLPHPITVKVHTDHSALKYLFAKKDAKARLLRWILLLQEFDLDVLDTKGAENLVADHLSRLEKPYENVLDPKEINETFPLETLSTVTFRGDSSASWFADFANYHAGNFVVKGMSSQQKNKFLKT
nr:reverse transcriptase domain-containing protein [Tanacetum cinerariifolium]